MNLVDLKESSIVVGTVRDRVRHRLLKEFDSFEDLSNIDLLQLSYAYLEAIWGRRYVLMHRTSSHWQGFVEADKGSNKDVMAAYLCCVLADGETFEAVIHREDERKALIYNNGMEIGNCISALHDSVLLGGGRRQRWQVYSDGQFVGDINAGILILPDSLSIHCRDGSILPLRLSPKTSFVDFLATVWNILSFGSLMRVNSDLVIPESAPNIRDDKLLKLYFTIGILFRILIYELGPNMSSM